MATKTTKNKNSENSGGLLKAEERVQAKFQMAVTDNVKELDNAFDIKMDDRENPTYNDIYLIERLSSAFLSVHEICAILQLPRHLFDVNLTLKAAYERGQEMGKASLRRLQWKSAQSNPVMQIWLGKQYLGQADKLETSKGEDKSAAYQQFVNKLKNIIDVSPKGPADRQPDAGGEGHRQVLLAPVGEGKPAGTDERPVVTITNDATDHTSVARESEKPRASIFRKLEDVVASSRSGIREDKDRSGVDSEKG